MAHFVPAKRDSQPQILWMYSPTALYVAVGYLTHSSLTAIPISSLILGTICKQYADTHRRAVEYAVGDKDWLSSKHIPALNTCPKFEPRFHGPFAIAERIDGLALPPTYECPDVFHFSQLVPDRPGAQELEPQEAVVRWHPTRDSAGNPMDQYEIDYIMDKRGSGDEAHYMVMWRGAPPGSQLSPVFCLVEGGKGEQEHPM
ncbi:hypothetical protein EMWEY_00030590 [Eimeria maxima]|uniref:Tf2-1-like SH3-like domain-containing protein n=1 Tax=Eimeria maxima TaxID=5804 RepID=U6M8B1_EIMMA|nr:hypothetical protein EMWEY_00030590 [Eimeria maxima]CDJ60447.1 hypothetical protein EMWEY_00030590 [Eimeria maxima]